MGVYIGKGIYNGQLIPCIKSFINRENKVLCIFKLNMTYSIKYIDKTEFILLNDWKEFLSDNNLYYMEILLCLIIEDKISIYKEYKSEEVEYLIDKYYSTDNCKKASNNIHKL